MLRLDFNLVFTILNILIWYVLIRKFLFKPTITLLPNGKKPSMPVMMK